MLDKRGRRGKGEMRIEVKNICIREGGERQTDIAREREKEDDRLEDNGEEKI